MTKALKVLGLAVFTLACWYTLNSGTHKAFAATTDYMPTCSGTNLETWNWPDWVKAPYVSGVSNGGNDSSFDPENSSYVIISNPSLSSPNSPDFHNNQLYIVYNSSSASKLTISHETISGIPRMVIRGANGYADIVSAPLSDGSVAAYYTTTHPTTPSGLTDPGKYFWVTPAHSTSDPTLLTPPDSSLGDNCVYTAKNVNYDPSFTNFYNTFSTHISYTQDAAVTTSCSTFAVGCWIGKAVDGISNAFIALFTDMARFIGNLFIPNGTQVKASFDSFDTFMSNKLGFLTYPFTFFGNLFSAFTTTTTGCSEYSCDKTFGNFYGQQVHIDFSAPSKISHATMDFFLLAIQGITVVTLLFAVYHKYLSIVGKQSSS